MTYFKKVIGDRLYLSPLNLEDAEVYCRWLADFSTSLPLGTGSSVLGVEQEKDFLKTLVKGQSFAMVSLETDELIGNISIFEINQIHRTATIGLFIGEPENRNKGYGKEGLRLALGYGFKVLNLNNIMLRVFAFNERAIQAYTSVGFKVIGKRREAHFAGGKYHDEFYMECLASEFEDVYLEKQLEPIIGKIK